MKKIKALGFVEVLIATFVAGVVSTVFLVMSGNAMIELSKTERIEYMARIATDGSNIAQEVANQAKVALNAEENPFDIRSGNCYVPMRNEIVGDEGDIEMEYYLLKNDNGEILEMPREVTITHIERKPYYVDPRTGEVIFRDVPVEYTYFREDRDLYVTNGADLYEDYFLVMCVNEIDDQGSWADVEFIVGDVKVEGEVTNDTDVADFTYHSVIDL